MLMNRKHHLPPSISLPLIGLLCAASLAPAATYRANFYESAAASPDETIGNADWDEFPVSNNASGLTLNDKTGSANASLTWSTGYSIPANDQAANIPGQADLTTLFNSYLHQGAGDGGITISGLTPGDSFTLRVYSDLNQAAVDPQNRTGTLAVLGATQSLSWENLDGGTTALVVNDGSPNHFSNVLDFTGTVDPSGTMTLQVTASSHRQAINGFELTTAGSGDPPPVIVSFTSSTPTFDPGDDITLSWEVTGSTSVSIAPGVGTVAASGSTVVTPATTTTYTLTALNGTTPATVQVTVTFSNGPIDVYLLGGQSNMQGVGRKSKLPADLLEIPEILLYHSTSVSSGQPANTWTTLRPAGWSGTAGGGFGPEIGFGERMRDSLPGTPMAFIKHAVGGTSLEIDWKPGANAADTGNWGPQFSSFVTTVNAGLSALIADGYQPTIKGMLWHQGEQDAKEGINAPESPTSATDYGDNLAAFIARVREQFAAQAAPGGIRFVLAQVLQYAPPGGDVQARFTGYLTVRQAELDADENSGAALSVTNTAAVPTNSTDHPTHEQEQDGYRDTDEVHMNATGQLALGRGMADKMLGLAPLGYVDWATSHGLAADSQGEDDDSDAVVNLLEFFHGTSPVDAAEQPSIAMSFETDGTGSDHFVLEFPLDLNADGLTWALETSSNLVDWSASPDNGVLAFISASAPVDGISTYRYRSVLPVRDPAMTRLFLRFRVTNQ